ncbi:MAG TPA: CDP-diacylglycerol--serine O-phosphatidyltransferase [Bdellovibrionota bacterium]|jgi:CDP-diacylglycerol--serine O-phosphatidyltransferase|nr:CDP-diacylglycerol--serine O-phosphatidyltransferase [Bdellovibrionota bacterium]
MRKIYLLPNFVTTINMFCGFYSVVASIQGDFVLAAWAVVAAGVFDMLDGRIARLAKATSSFGVEYDSLSDLVSFGMAPGVLVYLWALKPYGRLGWLAAFVFLACGALRLARFNVMTSRLPKGYFQGLPIPIAAGALSTFVIFQNALSIPRMESIMPVVLGLALGLATLMVSSIPFASFKELNWRSRASFGYLMVGVMAMVLVAVRPEVTLFLLISAYVALSLLWAVVMLARGQAPLSVQAHDAKS